MIISASRRTDIPAFHSDWFLDKVRHKGFCHVRNPYNQKVYEVSLKPEDVDGFVFWSRDYRNFEGALNELSSMGYRFYMQYTIIGYPKFIDPGSPSVKAAAKTAYRLRQRYGPRSVVWRYDPILLTSKSDAKWHEENFSKTLTLLKESTDECVISFFDSYRKVKRNLPPALNAGGATMLEPEMDELVYLGERLAKIASERGVKVTTCCEPGFLMKGVTQSACIDVVRLSDVADIDLTAIKRGPTRDGCGCAISKDIGAYDSCPAGCAYCYANRSQGVAIENIKKIKKENPTLL